MRFLFTKICAAATVVILTTPVTVLAHDDDSHAGEKKYLEYSIEYLDPKGVTTVSETGIAFVPFSGLPTYDGAVLPERYFGDYSLYFSNTSVDFRVHVKNVGKRTFRNLGVGARQELLNVDGRRGEPFGNVSRWVIEELRAGEEATLNGSVFVPAGLSSGLDQTHLRIYHKNGHSEEDDMDSDDPHGSVIIDDPQAGVWCPVLSEVT